MGRRPGGAFDRRIATEPMPTPAAPMADIAVVEAPGALYVPRITRWKGYSEPSGETIYGVGPEPSPSLRRWFEARTACFYSGVRWHYVAMIDVWLGPGTMPDGPGLPEGLAVGSAIEVDGSAPLLWSRLIGQGDRVVYLDAGDRVLTTDTVLSAEHGRWRNDLAYAIARTTFGDADAWDQRDTVMRVIPETPDRVAGWELARDQLGA